ncbi:MAG: hypothetical protein NT026_01375 [Candidatus Staskawiczbacteria bacterium]|nr:hypothetical protein [Candidatus Staskawiczbacteria bacterium]
MCAFKPVTNAEWSFRIAEGPFESDLVAITVCKTLGVDCEKEVVFDLSRHSEKWLGHSVRTRIKKIERVGEGQWTIIGDWLDAKFKERPCSFKATYSTSSRKGQLVFSFKYGQLLIDVIDGFAWVSFGQILPD